MYRKQQRIPAGRTIGLLSVLLSAVALEHGMITDPAWYYVLYITIPLLVICFILNNR